MGGGQADPRGTFPGAENPLKCSTDSESLPVRGGGGGAGPEILSACNSYADAAPGDGIVPESPGR